MNSRNRVAFEIPNLAELTQNHTVVDTHFHTRYSDGINTVSSIVNKAKRLKIGIAITDHNDIRGAVEIDKYKSILSIPGIEITSKEGTHILVYFYKVEDLKEFFKKYIKPHLGNDIMSPTSLKMEDIIKAAKKFKSVVIFPHPYSAMYTGIYNHHFHKDRIDKLLNMVHGVEVINSENIHKWNLRSTVLGFNLNKAIIGGSDGHTLYHMGKVVTYADCKKTRKDFLDAIKSNKTKVIGKEIDLLRKVTSNSIKLRVNLKNYPDIFEKNIKYSYKIIDSKTKQLGRNVKKIMNGNK